jgi:superoxide reductase
MLPVGGKMGGEGAFRHLPVFARGEQGCRVTVGRQVHVATEQHHIRWIEVSGPAGRQRTYFRPGQLPQVVLGPEWEGPLVAKVYCSQHGLWSGSEASGAALVEAAAAALAAESTCGHCHEA